MNLLLSYNEKISNSEINIIIKQFLTKNLYINFIESNISLLKFRQVNKTENID